MSRLRLCTLPLCAARCRHAGSPPQGCCGQERGGRRAPHCSSAASPGTCPAGSARSPASASSHPTGWPWWPLPLAEREGMSKDVSTSRRGVGIRDITQVLEVSQGRCLSSGQPGRGGSSAGTEVCPRQGRSAPQGPGLSTSTGIPSQAWHQPGRENCQGMGLGQVPFPQGESQLGREDPSPQGMDAGDGPCPWGKPQTGREDPSSSPRKSHLLREVSSQGGHQLKREDLAPQGMSPWQASRTVSAWQKR